MDVRARIAGHGDNGIVTRVLRKWPDKIDGHTITMRVGNWQGVQGLAGFRGKPLFHWHDEQEGMKPFSRLECIPGQ